MRKMISQKHVFELNARKVSIEKYEGKESYLHIYTISLTINYSNKLITPS